MESSAGPLREARRAHIDTLRTELERMISKSAEEEQEITLSKNEQTKVATLTVRSSAKNALSGRMISRLTEVLDELHEWREGKAVLLRGHANTFCSGSDLKGARATANQESGLQLAAVMQYNLMRLQTLHMISVAFVEGYALGGGAELAMGADLRIMSESAKIGFVHVKVGVCCGWGGASRLVQLVGPSRATDLLASGRSVRAQEALQIGLCNAIVADSAAAVKYVEGRAHGHPRVIRALKSVINAARCEPLQRALEIEAQLYASTWGQEEHLQKLDSNIKHNEQ